MLRRTVPVVAALTLAVGLSACGAANEEPAEGGDSTLSGTLNGGGASSQEAAVASWQKGFQSANPDVTVNYDPIGSGGGREQFLSGGISYAGSDAFLDDEELTKAEERCGGPVVEVPAYVSPIAVIYNLPGVDKLNLSPETIGGIFEGKITQWDDAAITADNPDAKLPSSKITPVHRSDDSGTTENFTDYLDAASGGSWTGGVVETWPVKGGEAAEGTSGVVSAVTNGKGTIGYADASQAGDLGTAAVKVGEEWVEYSPEAAAAVLDASKPVEGRGDDRSRPGDRPERRGLGCLPRRPGLVPDRLPEVRRQGHGRPRQGMDGVRDQHRRTGHRREGRRLRAVVRGGRRQGQDRRGNDRRVLIQARPSGRHSDRAAVPLI